ncbi:hypothetical protein QTO34_001642 [Cnephaeus nilssonii]|uniref:Ig-like domain-containing protein n=1 Tax=Cnephaeus nilssonii TaxID=3371016 RepID=A0AA40HX16_CNENI|nr:hypothetical protein QTO34_001642 [Eptesicus nilssonii]
MGVSGSCVPTAWAPRLHWAASPSSLHPLTDPSCPAVHFLKQVKSSDERVRYLFRDIYNGEEFVRFDSDVGEFRAVTELGRLDEKAWNGQKDLLEQKRAAVHTFCRHNYGNSAPELGNPPLPASRGTISVFQWPGLEAEIQGPWHYLLRGHRAVGGGLPGPGAGAGDEAEREHPGAACLLTSPSAFSVPAAPTVTVFPAKTQRLQHHNLLVCSVNSFYPGLIEVRWLRDGREEQAGVVSTGLIRNGDWTFQMLVMLETVPRSGEVYTCQVQHPSSSIPVTVEWSETPSDLRTAPPPPQGPLLVPEGQGPSPAPRFPLLGSLPQHRPQGSPVIAPVDPTALGAPFLPCCQSPTLSLMCPWALALSPVGWAVLLPALSCPL